MIAVILCAGFATRMYPLTRNFPKPLLKVGGRPVIDYLMDQVSNLDHLNTVHIISNDRFISHFQDWQKNWELQHPDKPIRIQLHNDGATKNDDRLGASADLQFVLQRIHISSPFLVSAGDNIFQFSIKSIWEEFIQSNSHYVAALPEEDPLKLKRTGVLELGSDHRVLNFHEKPEHPPSTFFCPPLYFLQPSAKKRLNAFVKSNENKDAPGHFIAYLCNKEMVYAFKPEGFRIDIGSIEIFKQADEAMKSESIKRKGF